MDGQGGKHRVRQGRLLALQFSPGDLAVAIAIQWQDQMQVAQGNIPAAGDCRAVLAGVQLQIAVTGLVGPGQPGAQGQQAQE